MHEAEKGGSYVHERICRSRAAVVNSCAGVRTRILTTKRLVLREPRLSDAPAVHHCYATDPDVTKYLTWRPHRDLVLVAFSIGDDGRAVGPRNWSRAPPGARGQLLILTDPVLGSWPSRVWRTAERLSA